MGQQRAERHFIQMCRCSTSVWAEWKGNLSLINSSTSLPVGQAAASSAETNWTGTKDRGAWLLMRVINAFQLVKAPVGKRPTGFCSLWRFLGKSGNLQPVLLQVSGQKNREHEQGGGGWGRRGGGRNKVSADRRREEERRGWISDQCSLITRAAEVQEPDVSNPVDTRGRAMGSGSAEGGSGAATHPQEIDVFPGNLGADKKKEEKKKGQGPSAALRTDWGIGRRKFIWCCHNTAAWQHNPAASAAAQVSLLGFVLFLSLLRKKI